MCLSLGDAPTCSCHCWSTGDCLRTCGQQFAGAVEARTPSLSHTCQHYGTVLTPPMNTAAHISAMLVLHTVADLLDARTHACQIVVCLLSSTFPAAVATAPKSVACVLLAQQPHEQLGPPAAASKQLHLPPRTQQQRWWHHAVQHRTMDLAQSAAAESQHYIGSSCCM